MKPRQRLARDLALTREADPLVHKELYFWEAVTDDQIGAGSVRKIGNVVTKIAAGIVRKIAAGIAAGIVRKVRKVAAGKVRASHVRMRCSQNMNAENSQ